jgi:hypothetical protein
MSHFWEEAFLKKQRFSEEDVVGRLFSVLKSGSIFAFLLAVH